MKVNVTLSVRGQNVPAEDLPDKTVGAALRKMGDDLGSKLADVKCPEHDKPVSNVRLHVNAKGDGDLAYDSCCEALGKAVKRVMG
jgi:hypothetical protein